MRLTTNDMARVVVQALYNLPDLPGVNDPRVTSLAKRTAQRLAVSYWKAVDILHREVFSK